VRAESSSQGSAPIFFYGSSGCILSPPERVESTSTRLILFSDNEVCGIVRHARGCQTRRLRECHDRSANLKRSFRISPDMHTFVAVRRNKCTIHCVSTLGRNVPLRASLGCDAAVPVRPPKDTVQGNPTGADLQHQDVRLSAR
jgi:hypothetical protein